MNLNILKQDGKINCHHSAFYRQLNKLLDNKTNSPLLTKPMGKPTVETKPKLAVGLHASPSPKVPASDNTGAGASFIKTFDTDQTMAVNGTGSKRW